MSLRAGGGGSGVEGGEHFATPPAQRCLFLFARSDSTLRLVARHPAKPRPTHLPQGQREAGTGHAAPDPGPKDQ